jgi:hypothetical protein
LFAVAPLPWAGIVIDAVIAVILLPSHITRAETGTVQSARQMPETSGCETGNKNYCLSNTITWYLVFLTN